MKCQHLAPATRLGFSLVMALAYSGLLAALLVLQPGATEPRASFETVRQAPAREVVLPLPSSKAPGSLRLRMTLPYMPGGGARPADQEI